MSPAHSSSSARFSTSTARVGGAGVGEAAVGLGAGGKQFGGECGEVLADEGPEILARDSFGHAGAREPFLPAGFGGDLGGFDGVAQLALAL